NYLWIYEFFTMTMFGAAYYILPQMVGGEFKWPALMKAHFALSSAGAFLLAIPLMFEGISQGLKLIDSRISFLDTSKSAMMYFRVSTTGEVLIAVGALFFFINVVSLIQGYYLALGKKAYLDATMEPTRVKA